jgi:transcriptional regulator with XRE-family HTH domain
VFAERLADGEEELLPVGLVDRLIAGEHPVRVWREYRGMTLQQLADACGVTNPAISQVEQGRRQPSLALLRAMARALRVGLDDLVPLEKKVEIDSSEAG